MIPYGRQNIVAKDVEAVINVLRSDFLTQGPMVPRFEKAVALNCHSKNAIAMNSATSCLHVACLALGLGPGDTLWTVPNTFVASANCGRYCGANVDFVDIQPDTWNMDVVALRQKLVQAKREGNLPKIVVPVHFGGQPTEQEIIWHLAEEFGFKVLEDASHSIGAMRHGEPVGSCKWSHITVFSFHPVKIITTCEGGMALTNDDEFAWRLAMLRSHGITRDANRMQQEPEGPWYYEQQELGYNYRMTDVQAALGLSQLERLNEFVELRNSLARRYNQLLLDLPLQLPAIRPENRSSYHLYVVRVLNSKARNSRTKVFNILREQNIGVNLHYTPVHLQPYYRKLGFASGMYPEAERYSEEAISLPLFPGLEQQDQDGIAAILRETLK